MFRCVEVASQKFKGHDLIQKCFVYLNKSSVSSAKVASCFVVKMISLCGSCFLFFLQRCHDMTLMKAGVKTFLAREVHIY